MKFIPAENGQILHRLELTRHNLEVLLAKLDDPLSQRKLVDPDWHVLIEATEEHVETTKGYFVPGAGQCVEVVPVENDVHYTNRKPGEMYMPSTGETI